LIYSIAIATSSAGESVLSAQSAAADCTGAVVYLADEITPGARMYTSRSLSTWLDGNNATAQALSGDGLTIVTLNKDFTTFQSARRSALQLLDFGAPSAADFVAINAMTAGTKGSLRGGEHKPLGDCATLLATYAANGGCINEDIVLQTRK
jgi:hypothetical protein